MYTIEKIDLSKEDLVDEDDIAKYQIIFRYEKSSAEVVITVQKGSFKVFPGIKEEETMLYVSSKTDGFHWLNFYLAQEPNATKLICEDRNEAKAILVHYYTGLRLPWDSQGEKDPSYPLKALRLEGIHAYDSMRIHSLKVSLLFQAHGFEYLEEDKETCFLRPLEDEDQDATIERIAAIIEPRFLLHEKFFPEEINNHKV